MGKAEFVQQLVGVIMKRLSSIENGKKGGRPVIRTKTQEKRIYEAEKVILTDMQYNALVLRYGSDVTNKAVEILDEWLASSPLGSKYVGKNNYAHFRSDGWVINTAKELLLRQQI